MTADTDALRRSPLGSTGTTPAHLISALGVEIRELPFTTQLNLRLDPNTIALDALHRAVGARPGPMNTIVTAGDSSVLRLAPDEWLVVGAALVNETELGLHQHGGTVVDVSAHRTVLELTGSGVRNVLASGCTVDLHPRSFKVGQCAQTTLARVDVIIARMADDEYRVFVRTSFARYLVDWLTTALED